jgi:hypothetical protein
MKECDSHEEFFCMTRDIDRMKIICIRLLGQQSRNALTAESVPD